MFLNKMGEQIFTCFEEEQLRLITGPASNSNTNNDQDFAV
jgi:hypothetical protein